MSKIVRRGLITLGLSIFFASVSANEADAQTNRLKDAVRAMDIYNKTLQSLQADVTMVKYNPQLKVSDVSIGKTKYLPKTGKEKMHVRIDWAKPVEEQIVVIGNEYKLYRPRLKQVMVGTTNKAKNGATLGGALSFLNMSKEQLKANYDVEFVNEEQLRNGTKAAHLLLKPKAKTSYKTAELWVDKDGVPHQAKITEKNDDTTTVLLENIKRNDKLSARLFTLDLPSSVKKVKA